MPNLNKVMLMGNLTRDPEIKYTPKGMAITQLGLAINRSWSNDAGEKQEETTFVDVDLFGRLAEIAAEYLKKGRPVYIEGRLKLDSWDDKASGQKRSKMKVVGEQMQLIGGRESGGEGGGAPRGEYGGESRPAARPPARAAAPPPRPPVDPDLDAAEDDIPF
ncbi:MAG: single-stranded DNA-binding protein [Verrucomicrobiota bacterium]